MLQRTAEVMDEITAAFETYEFFRFFQLLQNFCVTDLSNFYLDIAKDRLYVSAPAKPPAPQLPNGDGPGDRAVSWPISPVLCHMAEDIWQNLPYTVEETSVFQRGGPPFQKPGGTTAFQPRSRSCATCGPPSTRCWRTAAAGRNWASLAQPFESKRSPHLQSALEWLHTNGHPEVDGLRDWLLVSQLQLGGEPWARCWPARTTPPR